MLSTFLEFMRRERTLSFSAALCLLTLSAAVMPGVFQEDDPFENTNLWEGVESVESDIQDESVPASEIPELVDVQSVESELEPEVAAEEMVDSAQGDAFGLEDYDGFENAPDLQLNSEPESFVSETTPGLEPPLMTEEIALEPLESLEPVELPNDSLQPPVLEPEIVELEGEVEIETESEVGNIEFGDDLTGPADDTPTAEVSIETETESTSAQPGLKELPGITILEPVSPPEGVEDSGADGDQVVNQDAEPGLLLDDPVTQQGENVFQGQWVPPLTPTTLSPQLADETEPISPSSSDTDLLTESPEFEALPSQPLPEYDWSQPSVSVAPQGNSFATDQELAPSEAIIPLSSPQVLSDGYQPFAAGNPALGGEIELNPMHQLPLPGERMWTDNEDFVLDVPNVGSAAPAENSYSPMQSVIEPSQLNALPVDPSPIGAYEPVCTTPGVGNAFEGSMQTAPYEIPDVPNYGWTVAHPMLGPAPSHGRCRLLNRFAMGLSRLNIFRLRSFNLCPAKRAAVCQNQVCQNQSGHPRVTRGLLKNWFNRAPVRQKAAGLTGWLLSEPTCYPGRRAACGLTKWLLSPPNFHPIRDAGRWLMQPATCHPVRSTGRWLMQPATVQPCQGLKSFLFRRHARRHAPPTRGLLTRFYRDDNSSS